MVEEQGNRLTQSREAEFEILWMLYPRKLAKQAALKAFLARRREGVSFDDLTVAVDHYAKACEGKEPQFILHGATFFGPNRRWADYLTPQPPEAPQAPTDPPVRRDYAISDEERERRSQAAEDQLGPTIPPARLAEAARQRGVSHIQELRQALR